MLVGDQIAGRYRLLRPVAAGGMGEVWAARNELTGRDFAIKFLLKEFAHSAEAFERFVREAETTGKLRHPSIVDVFDVAQTEDGRPFIVMELLSGEDLETRLDREGTLSPLRVAAYFSQIATGLALAHRAGVVHRDLSASNIFLTRHPEGGEAVPKILDFGVSKQVGPNVEGRVRTLNGAVLGNPVYMSPEQARGAENVDERTDVWSLGIVMYQCLTGTVPFRSNNYNALMVEIMTEPHRPVLELVPTVDRELCQLIEACLHKEREQRPRTAREIGVRLGVIARRLAGDSQAVSRSPRRRATDRLPPPPSAQERRQEAARAAAALPIGVRLARTLFGLRPSRGLVAALATALGALVGILASGYWHRLDQETSREPGAELGTDDTLETRVAQGTEPITQDGRAASGASARPSLSEQRLRLSTREIKLGNAAARAISGKKQE